MNEYTNEETKLLIIFFNEVNCNMIFHKKYIQKFNQDNLLWTNINDAKPSAIEQLLNSMADGWFVTNVKGIIKQVNPAAEQLFGYGKLQGGKERAVRSSKSC